MWMDTDIHSPLYEFCLHTVMFITQVGDFDLSSSFTVGILTIWLFMAHNRSIQNTNTLDCSAVMSCDSKLILLHKTEFSFKFYLVTAIHKFDCRLIINWTSNKWQPVEVTETYNFDSSHTFSFQALHGNKTPPHPCWQCQSLINYTSFL